MATLSKPAVEYASPDGEPVGQLAASWYGQPSALPVIDQRPGYLRVRLAQRPNESTAWIKSDGVQLVTTAYRIVITLATRHLALYRDGKLVMNAPAGIGTGTDPTPTGHFFAAFFAEAPSPGWGPFLLLTSAHSNAISDWEKTGDAITAIHGPLDSDAQIGTTGAQLSHGCVRLHTTDLEQLRAVPAGSPIDIVA